MHKRETHPAESVYSLSPALLEDLGGNHFSFYVVSAAPEEVIESALAGIVPEDHIYGTRFRYASRIQVHFDDASARDLALYRCGVVGCHLRRMDPAILGSLLPRGRVRVNRIVGWPW